MPINLKDISQLQREVRDNLAHGAPGRRGGFGCCAAATDTIVERDGPHRSASLEDRIKRFAKVVPKPARKLDTVQFRKAAEKVMGLAQPEPQKKPAFRAQQQAGVKELRYSYDALRHLIVDDMNSRGIDLGVVRVEFDDASAVIHSV